MITAEFPSISLPTRPTGMSAYAEEEANVIIKRQNEYIGVSVIARLVFQSALRKRFDYLKNAWIQDTIFSSSVSEITSHPAYQEIIALGNEVLPLILNDLYETELHWFYALEKITGHSPIKPEHKGSIPEMKNDWINWGKLNVDQ